LTELAITPLVAGADEDVAEISTSLSDIQTVVNGGLDTDNFTDDAGILGSQLSPAAGVVASQFTGTITDSKLASPSGSSYTPILRGGGATGGLLATDSCYLATDGTWAPSPWATTAVPPMLWCYQASAYAVAGKTANFRLRVWLASGSTVVSGASCVCTLSAVEIRGGAWDLYGTGGTSNPAHTPFPAANSFTSAIAGSWTDTVGADAFELVDGGYYAIAINPPPYGAPAGTAVGAELSVSYTDA